MEAATRKHEAIETDIGAYWERVAAVEAVAKELDAEGYHDVRRILARRDNVLRLWEYLKELLAARRERLNAHRDLQRLFEEMRYIMDWMADMKVLTHSAEQMHVYLCSFWLVLNYGFHCHILLTLFLINKKEFPNPSY